MARPATGQTIAAIERAMDVLSLFADTDGQDLGVSEIAAELGLSKAVVHRILSSFRLKGYVQLNDETRRYSLGPEAMSVGLAYMEKIDVGRLARPVIVELSRATNETSTLSLLVGSSRVYIDQVTPLRDIKMVVRIGKEYPLHAGASSKAFLAFLGDEMIDEVLSASDLPKLTRRTVTSQQQLRRDLAEIRARGYAVSLGERMEGAGSVAAPVFGRDGRPAAVISICGPLDRFRGQVDEAARLLMPAVQELSRNLGYDARRLGVVPS